MVSIADSNSALFNKNDITTLFGDTRKHKEAIKSLKRTIAAWEDVIAHRAPDNIKKEARAHIAWANKCIEWNTIAASSDFNALRDLDIVWKLVEECDQLLVDADKISLENKRIKENKVSSFNIKKIFKRR